MKACLSGLTIERIHAITGLCSGYPMSTMTSSTPNNNYCVCYCCYNSSTNTPTQRFIDKLYQRVDDDLVYQELITPFFGITRFN